jgi:hypothetical protein
MLPAVLLGPVKRAKRDLLGQEGGCQKHQDGMVLGLGKVAGESSWLCQKPRPTRQGMPVTIDLSLARPYRVGIGSYSGYS